MKTLKQWLNKNISEDVLYQKGQYLYSGLDDNARYFALTILLDNEWADQSFCFITPNEAKARDIYRFLGDLDIPDERIIYIPAQDFIPFELVAKSEEVKLQKINALARLQTVENPIVITSIRAYEDALLPYHSYCEQIFAIDEGMIIEPEDLKKRLLLLGYKHSPTTEMIGEFSMHGGIIDVFTPQEEHPIRIEFFDNEIESLRYYDAKTQKSIGQLEKVQLFPSDELTFTEDMLSEKITALKEAYGKQSKLFIQKKNKEALENLEQHVKPVLDDFLNELKPARYKLFMPYFFDELSSIFDYCPHDTKFIFADFTEAIHALRDLSNKHDAHITDALKEGYLLPKQRDVFLNEARLHQDLQKNSVLALSLLPQMGEDYPFLVQKSLRLESLPAYYNDLKSFQMDFNYWQSEGNLVIFLYQKDEEKKRLQAYLENKITAPESVVFLESNLSTAVFWHDKHTVFISVDSIFKYKKHKRKGLFADLETESYEDVEAFKLGDYVVHDTHGIGIYMGLESMSMSGETKDYLIIKYRGTDKVFVPVEQFQKIKKYIADTDKKPRLSKLGTAEWAKAKQRTQGAVAEIAKALLKIHAEREARPGFAFSPDGEEQKIFEASFPYVETPDQLQAIKDVKADMMRPVPMDRLVCGDVGYGKTEVAIRAIYKAVMDNKQVAFLVPTTVLAQQHFRNFQQRFEDFGVEIAMLTRFTTAKEEKEIHERLKNHTLDVVVGTHKLLNKHIKFHDLGLLVIDEEQRFGVTHKERIKSIRTNIDVLTLSATPIPRTLHLSLVGVREMSLINTPPANRFPIQTYVLKRDFAVMVEACRRELAREGQVFVVHNRIKDLEEVAWRLQKEMPEARILVAHGQMHERKLEEVMLSFINHEADILICTTIIETGMDIPNVNTLIVDDADQMGLSQLYQLRGRVGRSDRIAYAYLLYQPQKILTPLAEERLMALKEYTALGSGYKIAMRDLKLRGVGNILGAEQSGHMTAVGFEMYLQLLAEAVAELKGEKKPQYDVEVDLHIDAYLPHTYITEESLRLRLYNRMQSLEDEAAIKALQAEFEDRFGAIPTPTNNLFTIVNIKLLAQRLLIKEIIQRNTDVRLRFYEDDSPAKFLALQNLITQHDDLFLDNQSGELVLVWRKPGAPRFSQQDLINLLEVLKEFLDLAKLI